VRRLASARYRCLSAASASWTVVTPTAVVVVPAQEPKVSATAIRIAGKIKLVTAFRQNAFNLEEANYPVAAVALPP
jgi:hypothetical protein